MGKKIYRLLNEVNTDFAEYEISELSSEEKELHKKRILQEVRTMNANQASMTNTRTHTKNDTYRHTNHSVTGRRTPKTKSTNRLWLKVTGIAAACLIIIGGAGLTANPVLAKEIFNSLFGNLIDNAKGEKYEAEDTEKYTKIGANSVSVQEETARQPEESFATEATDSGVTVSVSDIYCDGYVLYYTASLKTDQTALTDADGILTESAGENPDVSSGETITVDGMELGGVSRAFEKSADGSFVTVRQIDLLNPIDSTGQSALSLDGKDTLTVDWSFSVLTGNLWNSWDASGEYMTTGSIEGDWHMRFPVTIDRTGNKVTAVNKEENGVLVKNATQTKAGLVIEAELPDFSKAPYNDPYNDPDIAVKDSAGNYLQWMSMKSDLHPDGTSTLQVMVLYDGEKDLTFEVTARDEEANTIAAVSFQLP